MIATNKHDPVVCLCQTFIAFLIDILVIARSFESEATVTSHDDKRIRHAILHTALKDKLGEFGMNITAHHDAFGIWEFLIVYRIG